MAYIRIVLKGTLGTVEVWSTSLNFGVNPPLSDVPDQATNDAIQAAVRSFLVSANLPGNIKSLMSSSVSITEVRTERRATSDDRTLNVSEGLLSAAIPGTSSANKTPQDCMVLSLRTNTPGPSGRGRIFWPALGALLGPTFQLITPAPAALATDFSTFLTGIRTAIDAGFTAASLAFTSQLSVRSLKNRVNVPVVRLQIGSVLDTQRRRRDSIPETYSSVNYP